MIAGARQMPSTLEKTQDFLIKITEDPNAKGAHKKFAQELNNYFLNT
jgi:hypothetical protein